MNEIKTKYRKKGMTDLKDNRFSCFAFPQEKRRIIAKLLNFLQKSKIQFNSNGDF
jgi:hypothetical protein